ncbi:MAG: AAA family ATPase [Acidimicrobiales bacterium]|nr:AAA family ATPase [Acidimicrobiales bacterium]
MSAAGQRSAQQALLDLRVCPACGERAAPHLVSEDPPRLGCQFCGAERSVVRGPLFCLTGSSGVGKSTVASLVGRRLAGVVTTLEQDVLWHPRLADIPNGTAWFRATWLRLAAMVAQHGPPVLLCGTVVPAELEAQPERCLFSGIHYLALTAPAEVLAARLRARPAWRGWDEARIAEMLGFAAELERDAARLHPPVRLLDTTGREAPELAADVAAWVLAALPAG